MPVLSRGAWALAIPVAALLFADAAMAESRLFSARTGQPGVNVVSAAREGKALPVAGQNGDQIFFRIDNPAGPVPCPNTLRFTLSNGQTLDRQIDLCAANWAVNLAAASGGSVATGVTPTEPTPTPTPPAAKPPVVKPPVLKPQVQKAPTTPPAPTAQAGTITPIPPPLPGGQPVVIATDDPEVVITNVFVGGKEVSIDEREDPYVGILLAPTPEMFSCQRDLGLALSDGRRLARQVDVCAVNFIVVVQVTGAGAPPPVPEALRPAPMPAMQAPLTPLEPPADALPEFNPAPSTPGDTGEVAFVDTMQWLFARTDEGASLAYAIPETDAGEFSAVCQTGAKTATVTLDRGAPELTPGGQVSVQINAGEFSKAYTATGSEFSELDGLSHPVLQIPTTDPLWGALIRERAVSFMIGTSPPYALSLSGSSVKAKQFLAACNPPPPTLQPPTLQPVEPPILTPIQRPALLPPGSVPPDSGAAYFCEDGSSIAVGFGDDTALVSEPGGPPIVLFTVPSQGGARFLSGLSELIVAGPEVYWTREGMPQRVCAPN